MQSANHPTGHNTRAPLTLVVMPGSTGRDQPERPVGITGMGNLKQGKMTKHNFESVFYKIIKADRYVVQMGQISVDRAAIGVVALAIGLGLLVFIETPEQPTRLSRFVAEHVVHFGIVDSLPLRLAFLSFFGALVAGGLFLRMADGTGRRLLEARRRQRWIELATGALIILHIVALSRSGMALPFSVTPLADAIYLAYGACAAVFIWNHRLPWQVVLAAILFIVLLAWWPATTGLMSRVHAPGMSLIDEHFAALFSGGQMLDFGYQLFLDVPARYGILTPIAIASAIRAGVEFDLGRLLHLVEFFQVLTFLLFIGSAWALTRGSEPRSRLVAVLLVVLVSAPFLSLGSPALHYPNQSGFRFVMLPVGVLMLTLLQRGSLITATGLSGAVSMLALLHNLETGIVILVGLGFAWLCRARDERANDSAFALAAGFASALAVAMVLLLAHRLVLGIWLVVDVDGGLDFMKSFLGGGFGGMRPPLHIVVFVIFGYTGYVFVRAFAWWIGRQDDRPNVAISGIAAMLIAWAPYYANRPADWNLWTFLALFALLLAPAVAANNARRVWLAMIVVLLVLPIPLKAMHGIARHLATTTVKPAEHRCAAGLSLPAEVCAGHRERTGELVRLATQGDVLWITGYPFLTLQMTGLRPLVAPLDIYGAALFEANLVGVAARIRAARPIALLIDGTVKSLTGKIIPAPVRSLQKRIAALAGFEHCSLLGLSHWQVWLPPVDCTETAVPVLALRTRAAGE